MKVLVAGAAGVIGRALVPLLVERGHEVAGMTRKESNGPLLRSLGAQPVIADALDAVAVGRIVSAARPEVIVDELTALSAPISLRDARRPDRAAPVVMTSRLRTEGTDNLLAAGRAAGTARFVAQSFAAFRFASSGGPVFAEADPMEVPPPVPHPGLEAILHLERAVTAIDWGDGVVLRYGALYGPGTAISADPDAQIARPVRRGQFPIVGDGGGITSYVHVADAAAATAIATEHGAPGLYNIVDDEPAAVSEWLPVLASVLGAKKPRTVPRWLAELVAGRSAIAMMTQGRGASNEKAKQVLGWKLQYPSWRLGFLEGLR